MRGRVGNKSGSSKERQEEEQRVEEKVWLKETKTDSKNTISRIIEKPT